MTEYFIDDLLAACKQYQEKIAEKDRMVGIYKDMASEYVRFMNWAYLKDPSYWGKLMDEYTIYKKELGDRIGKKDEKKKDDKGAE